MSGLPSIFSQWMIEDGAEGWYVVRPWDAGRVGPFTEEEAAAEKVRLQALYPMGATDMTEAEQQFRAPERAE